MTDREHGTRDSTLNPKQIKSLTEDIPAALAAETHDAWTGELRQSHGASSSYEAYLLFAGERGGMLRLVHRSSGWWLEIDRCRFSVTDKEAERLTLAMEEAGIRV